MPVTYELKSESKHGGQHRLSVWLRNCRIHLKNNQRNLDTRFFATPVLGVTAIQRQKDVELRIVLKEPATATPRTESGPAGTHFVVLQFPRIESGVEKTAPSDSGTSGVVPPSQTP
jgi:hypothetical protein